MKGINPMHPKTTNIDGDTTERDIEPLTASAVHDQAEEANVQDEQVLHAAGFMPLAKTVKKPPIKGVVDKAGKKPPVEVGGGDKDKVPPSKPPIRISGDQEGKVPPVKPPVNTKVKPLPVKPPVKASEKPPVEMKMPADPTPPSRLDKLLSIVNTATGVLQLIHPLNSVFNPDGTVTYPDGSVADTKTQSVTRPNGAVQNIDGTTVHADGSTEHPDGSVLHKDGTWVFADGSVNYPDGRWKHADGTVTDAEGNVIGVTEPVAPK
ncbi:hypothetical protein [Pseudomonas alliivorans]